MSAASRTVHYQRPLPETVRPGHTLTEEQAREIEILVARRDEQIRFLHERELKSSRLIENLTASPLFRLDRALTWPARPVRSLLGSNES